MFIREAAWTAAVQREGPDVPGESIVARNSSQGGKKYPKPVWYEDHEMREEARIFLDEFSRAVVGYAEYPSAPFGAGRRQTPRYLTR